MVAEILSAVVIILAAALLGGLIGVNTRQEIKKYGYRLNSAKEILIFLIGILLVLMTNETLVNTLVILALGALTTTVLNKFWLGRANRYLELALLGLAIGAAFSFSNLFGFVLTAFIVLYNILTESVAVVQIMHKKTLHDAIRGIGLTQSTLLFGAFLSFALFAATGVTPIAFMLYLAGAIFFLVFEPGAK
jgi:hypothetical protein